MQQGRPGTPLVYFVFDLLELEGEPLVDLPLIERHKRLRKLLDRRNRTVRLSEVFEDGEALLRGRQAAEPRRDHGEARRLAATPSAAARATG